MSLLYWPELQDVARFPLLRVWIVSSPLRSQFYMFRHSRGLGYALLSWALKGICCNLWEAQSSQECYSLADELSQQPNLTTLCQNIVTCIMRWQAFGCIWSKVWFVFWHDLYLSCSSSYYLYLSTLYSAFVEKIPWNNFRRKTIPPQSSSQQEGNYRLNFKIYL